MKKTEIEDKIDTVYELAKEKAKRERISQLKDFVKELGDIRDGLEQSSLYKELEQTEEDKRVKKKDLKEENNSLKDKIKLLQIENQYLQGIPMKV